MGFIEFPRPLYQLNEEQAKEKVALYWKEQPVVEESDDQKEKK